MKTMVSPRRCGSSSCSRLLHEPVITIASNMLDGEGGYTVFGKLVPASASLAKGYLPLGLAHQVKLLRPVAKDACVNWTTSASTRLYPLSGLQGTRRLFASSSSRK